MIEYQIEKKPLKSKGEREASFGIRKWLFTANPFYVISTALMIVGFKVWTEPMPLDESLWWLLGGLTAFTITLATVCIVLVRIGKVWEDTRTLFFLLDLLYFFISASLDRPLQEAYTGGRALSWIGLGVCIATTEAVLKGTGIYLSKALKICHHLCLALTFLAPLYLVGTTGDEPIVRSTALLILTVVWPLLFLMVLPSCRPPAKKGAEPWSWPLMPLSLFVFLAILSMGRSYLLAIPFGPGTGYDVVLSSLHLAPALWVMGVILQKLELDNHWVYRLGKYMPWVPFALMLIDKPSNRFQVELQNLITSNLASPLYLAMVYLVIHNLYLSLKSKDRGNETTISLFIAMFIGPSTQGLYGGLTFEWGYTLPFLGWCCYLMIQKKSSIHAFALSTVGMLCLGDVLSEEIGRQWKYDLIVHGILLSLLLISMLFKDIYVRRLQITFLLTTLLLLVVKPLGNWDVASDEVYKHLYMLTLNTILFMWCHHIRSRRAFWIACTGVVWQLLIVIYDIVSGIKISGGHKGPLLLFLGFAALITGLGISLKKMNRLSFKRVNFGHLIPKPKAKGEQENFSGSRVFSTGIVVLIPFLIWGFIPLWNSHSYRPTEKMLVQSQLRSTAESLLSYDYLNAGKKYSPGIIERIKSMEPYLFEDKRMVIHPHIEEIERGSSHSPIAYVWLEEKKWGSLIFADCRQEELNEKPTPDVWKERSD